MHVNVHKLYKGIDWVNDLLSKEAEFKSLVKLYPTYKAKQRNKNFKWTVHFLAIATYA